MGDVYRVTQFIYPLLYLTAIILVAVGLFAVVSWPRLPGKGFLVTALALLLACYTGYFLLNTATFFRPANWLGRFIMVAYILVTVIGIAGYGFLLAGLIALSRFFRGMRYSGDVQ